MKRSLTSVMAVACICTSSIASAVTFTHVCSSSLACDDDVGFSFSITLDDSVVVPGGTYNTSSDGGAALLAWRATSSVGDGFTISGAMAEVTGASKLTFTFDASANLSGIEETGSGLVFAFENTGVGRIRFHEPTIFRDRTDYGPAYFFDGTDIVANWQATPAVPLPAGLVLLLSGIGALAAAYGRHSRRSVSAHGFAA